MEGIKPPTHELSEVTRELTIVVGTKALGFAVKKKDLGNYHDRDFWVWLDYWWWWHEKGLLPLPLPWTDHPKVFIEMMVSMENLYSGYWREKHSDH